MKHARASSQSALSRREALAAGVGAGLAIALDPLDRLSALLAQVSRQSPLIQRAIPSSGEKIPVIGIGTARRYDVGATAEERAPLREVLRRFAEMGGKLVDTAPSYGTAEPVVGDLVQEVGNRSKLFLATKV